MKNVEQNIENKTTKLHFLLASVSLDHLAKAEVTIFRSRSLPYFKWDIQIHYKNCTQFEQLEKDIFLPIRDLIYDIILGYEKHDI